MDLVMLVLCAVIAYLLGSINSGIIFTKLFTGDDLRSYGSGNAGATNAFRVLGKKAIFVVAGDILKGVAAVFIGKLLHGENGMLCGYVFVLLGHAYPIFFGLRGGKAILTTAAAIAVIDWRVTVILFTLFVLIVLITRYISLGSIISVSLIPLVLWLFGWHNEGMIICTMFASVWMVMLHRENIERLLAGKERKFYFKSDEQ